VKSRSLERAARKVYGRDMADLEARFRRSLEGR
jgi:hypothetical protein